MAKHYSEMDPEELTAKLRMHLHDLGISPSNVGALDQQGIYTLNDLLGHTKEDLIGIPNLGPKSVQNILNVIREHGFY